MPLPLPLDSRVSTQHLPLLKPGDLPGAADPASLRSPRAFTTAVSSCHRCPLADDRLQVVPGSGADDADVLLLGLAPGRQEDVQGQPFVGAAGNVIDNALAAAGATRAEVHLTTLVKCHPTGDRAPSAIELEACFPWLVEQVAMLRPKVIVALGELPTAALLRRRVPLSRVAGLQLTVWEDITLIPTHDPVDATRGGPRAATGIRHHIATALAVARAADGPGVPVSA